MDDKIREMIIDVAMVSKTNSVVTIEFENPDDANKLFHLLIGEEFEEETDQTT